MKEVSRVLIEVAQTIPLSVKMYLTKEPTSATDVQKGIQRIAKGKREDYCKVLDEVLMVDGGIKCDGLKNEMTADRYYEFILHYVQVKRSPYFSFIFNSELKLKVLVMNYFNGAEDTESLRELMNAKLEDSVGKKLGEFANSLTFLTDCEPTMEKCSISPSLPDLWSFGKVDLVRFTSV